MLYLFVALFPVKNKHTKSVNIWGNLSFRNNDYWTDLVPNNSIMLSDLNPKSNHQCAIFDYVGKVFALSILKMS